MCICICNTNHEFNVSITVPLMAPALTLHVHYSSCAFVCTHTGTYTVAVPNDLTQALYDTVYSTNRIQYVMSEYSAHANGALGKHFHFTSPFHLHIKCGYLFIFVACSATQNQCCWPKIHTQTTPKINLNDYCYF